MRVRLSSTLIAFVCLILSATAIAQTRPTPPALEVVYMLNGATVQTYNIDRDTGLPTQQGEAINLFPERAPNYADWAIIQPSADGHFLYVTGGDSDASVNLRVFATESNGVPRLPVLQDLSFGLRNDTISNFEISPNRKLAYAVQNNYDSQGELLAQLRKFVVDPDTGLVQEDPKPVVRYPTNLSCGGSLNSAELVLSGFNNDGTAMYESWNCYLFHDAGTISNYYSRMVNQNTGGVGPDKFLLSGDGAFEVGNNVSITPISIVDFSWWDYAPGGNSVNIYGLNGGSTPLFTCNADVLEACGYAFNAAVDPSGQWLFLQTSADSTQVTQIDLAAKQILNTDYYLEGVVRAISPDNSFIYTQDTQFSDPWLYYVYTFDPKTGAVQFTGGQIWQQAAYVTVVPALRR